MPIPLGSGGRIVGARTALLVAPSVTLAGAQTVYTNYAGAFATAAEAALRCHAGTAAIFSFNVFANTLDSASTATVLVNGLATALAVPIAAGETGHLGIGEIRFHLRRRHDRGRVFAWGVDLAVDQSPQRAHLPGRDLMPQPVVISNGTILGTTTFVPMTESVVLAANQTGFLNYAGSFTNEAAANVRLPLGTIARVGLNVSSNSLNSASTVTLRKNSSDAGVSFSIAAGTTGQFLASTAIVVADGDLACLKIVVGGTGGSQSIAIRSGYLHLVI